MIQTASDPRSLMGAVQRELRAIDPAVAVEHIKTMEEIRAESVASQTFAMRLLVGFSLVGSILALVGVYGVRSLSVGSRSQEFAIRLAVGAQRSNVLGLIMGQGLKLIVIGVTVGIGVALAFAEALRGFLFGVGPTDPTAFVGAATLCTAVALLACLVPGLRATRVDPMTALRYE